MKKKRPTPADRAREKSLNDLVTYLFTNGVGEVADRLVLTSKDGRDLGGWGREMVREAIEHLHAQNAALAERVAPARKGVYVASRASVPERGAMWRRLRSEGWPIVSTWIDEDGPGQTADPGELWVRIAAEVTGAAGLVLYAEPDDFPLKGALVEVGMALAAGVPVVVVAPGVEIELKSCRPFGSWVRHPLVAREPFVVDAFQRLGAEPVPAQSEALSRAVEKQTKGA